MKYLTVPLFVLLVAISHNAHTEEKSIAEKIGNTTGDIVRPVTEGLFTLTSLANQGIKTIENVKYDLRDSYYDFEYDFRKGYQQDN